MAIYLDEDRVGQDPIEICYPHLLLCMGVTVQMADGTLIGAHFSSPSTEAAVGAEMLQQIQAHSSTMRLLYCTGNLPVHTTQCGGMDVKGKANLIGFQGDAYSFDTSMIEPKDGTFVVVRSFGANKKCGIYYKRDEKVRDLYDRSDGPNVAKVQSRGLPVVNEPSGISGLTAPVHKLHRAYRFMLQIKHYTIP
jgi:hypothetical protein